MDPAKKRRLESKGWRVGSVQEFLNLSNEEAAYIEMKLALSKTFHQRRREKKLTQLQVAKLLKSSQSRVAKMESGDPSVSLDLLVRSLLALGTPKQALGRVLSNS
jgi:predicted XRE-type DNA-binding protein